MHIVTNPRGASEPALSRLRAELQAIPAAQVLRLNVSVPRAVTTITMSLPRVRQLQPRMLVELPRFDTTLLDKLPDYAGALFEAHLQCETAVHAPPPKGALFKRAKHLRQTLLADATALAGRGVIDRGVLQYRIPDARQWLLQHRPRLGGPGLRAQRSLAEDSRQVPDYAS